MKKDIEAKFEDAILKLFEKASDDGMISDEEGKLIMSMKPDLNNYIRSVKKAEFDGFISDEEAADLKELKDEIVSKAAVIATNDYVFDDDERQLIKKLFDILTEVY